MLIKTAILDDDKVFCEILTHYISKIEFLHLEGTYHDVFSALSDDRAFQQLDLLFLDVEMPGMTGVELLASFDDTAPKVVMISGKREYGVEAFDYDVVDYLQKPITFSRFVKAIKKVQKVMEEKLDKEPNISASLFIRVDGLWKRLAFTEICLIKSHNNSVIVKTEDESFESPMRLKDIVDRLPEGKFMQVHRSYIVNLEKISKVDGEIIEVGERTVPVSRTYIQTLYDRLNIDR
ncbi:MAG: response regulator transcription factor [Flavobacteriales bacterium]|nr:response regulator transcription factor [Flavobacteriales bacterium]MCB9447781.1 response regulator transcription factor [Flavobacteriales bacterium]